MFKVISFKELMILVEFTPKLDELKVKEEAVRMFEKKDDIDANQTELLVSQEAKDPVREVILFKLISSPDQGSWSWSPLITNQSIMNH